MLRWLPFISALMYAASFQPPKVSNTNTIASPKLELNEDGSGKALTTGAVVSPDEPVAKR